MDKCLETIQNMAQMPIVKQMESFGQHGSCTTYHHSLHVALTAYRIKNFFHLNVNEVELARGAVLHDFFLYDIKSSETGNWEHGTKHAQIALDNANECFDLSDTEKDIIYSHMWPLNITHLPRRKESVIVSIADKYCALIERANSIFGRENLKSKKFRLLQI